MANELYRYEYGYYSQWSAKISLHTFKIVKETPKGFWFYEYGSYGTLKWTSKTTNKRYAYEDKKLALRSFLARKTRQVKILDAQLDKARVYRNLAEKLLKEDKLPDDIYYDSLNDYE